MADAIVLGIDWYRRGWVGVVLRPSSPPAVVVDRALDALIARLPEAECIAIDMPLGLPAGEREADVLARRYVGRWRSSVFMTPPRAVLEAETYAAANAIAPELTGGKKISQQAWSLRYNIAVVERLAVEDPRVIEVHPEVSFRAMVGHELEHAKSTWNGQRLRLRCLAGEDIVLPDHLDEGGDVPVADVLDAAAAVWSARRYARHEERSLPEGSASVSPTRSSSEVARSRASALRRPWSAPCMWSSSRPVMSGSIAASWRATPIERPTASAWRTTS